MDVFEALIEVGEAGIDVGEDRIEVGEACTGVGEARIDVGAVIDVGVSKVQHFRFSSILDYPALLENLMAGKSNGWKI